MLFIRIGGETIRRHARATLSAECPTIRRRWVLVLSMFTSEESNFVSLTPRLSSMTSKDVIRISLCEREERERGREESAHPHLWY